MQWYGFHKEAAGGTDAPGTRKQRLMDIFGHWCDNVVELIKATPEDDILRRDIFDRPPIFKWADGRVVLVGDSAHAMQPNLGQGGCMAIEDGYTLARDLAQTWDVRNAASGVPDFTPVLRGYMNKRIMRVSAIHGMAGMAAFMASTYKAYLGEGMGAFGKWVQQFKIPHPGRVCVDVCTCGGCKGCTLSCADAQTASGQLFGNNASPPCLGVWPGAHETHHARRPLLGARWQR